MNIANIHSWNMKFFNRIRKIKFVKIKFFIYFYCYLNIVQLLIENHILKKIFGKIFLKKKFNSELQIANIFIK